MGRELKLLMNLLSQVAIFSKTINLHEFVSEALAKNPCHLDDKGWE
jgi:hypothetical protein